MTKTLIDIDDEQLGEAAEALGTGTKKETVAAALERAIQARRREEFIEHLAEDPYPDLRNPEVMKGARQHLTGRTTARA